MAGETTGTVAINCFTVSDSRCLARTPAYATGSNQGTGIIGNVTPETAAPGVILVISIVVNMGMFLVPFPLASSSFLQPFENIKNNPMNNA